MYDIVFVNDGGALVHDFINELASIRSAAEILRDVPELNENDRMRFVAVALEGERRLEDLLPKLQKATCALGSKE